MADASDASDASHISPFEWHVFVITLTIYIFLFALSLARGVAGVAGVGGVAPIPRRLSFISKKIISIRFDWFGRGRKGGGRGLDGWRKEEVLICMAPPTVAPSLGAPAR